MGYDARASNGERPQHVTDRRFRFDAAVAINNQATAINQALSTTRTHQELLTQLAADYLRLRKDVTALAADYALLKQEHRVALSALTDLSRWRRGLESRPFWQRVWWLLSGR